MNVACAGTRAGSESCVVGILVTRLLIVEAKWRWNIWLCRKPFGIFSLDNFVILYNRKSIMLYRAGCFLEEKSCFHRHRPLAVSYVTLSGVGA